MTVETTYTHARGNFAALLNEVTRDREIIIIRRRGAESVALVAADELAGLLETAHLLRSPANAGRLLAALVRARDGENAAQTVEDLRREVGITRAP